MSETGWLIIGANGQLGKALQAVLASRDDVTFWGRDEADLANPKQLKDALKAIVPTAIINAAAYTAVDKAEEEEAVALAVNADSVGIMADFCAARGIPLVHYSTDYVFDGSGDAPHSEGDATAPINVYGRSKLAGEQAIAASGCAHLIFRTSWVYDAAGKNFVNTMLRLGAEREELRVVADQIGSPTYAPHLAEVSMAAFARALGMSSPRRRGSHEAIEADSRLRGNDDIIGFPSGIYHAVGGGEYVSWHGFAEAIFAQSRAQGEALKVQHVLPIAASEYPTPAKRPANSRLATNKLHDVIGLSMPSWQDGLAECLKQRAQLKV